MKHGVRAVSRHVAYKRMEDICNMLNWRRCMYLWFRVFTFTCSNDMKKWMRPAGHGYKGPYFQIDRVLFLRHTTFGGGGVEIASPLSLSHLLPTFIKIHGCRSSSRGDVGAQTPAAEWRHALHPCAIHLVHPVWPRNADVVGGCS
jgi:hypothetical protein